MKKTLFNNLCIFLTLLLAVCECDYVQIPIVGIEMDESGFHRDLVYTVQFDYPLAGKECEYILEQHLPAAVYVSIDQLDDLKRLKKLDAIYPKFVDIEAATEQSEPFSVLLKGVPKITDTIKLPIHFRYHAPDDKKKFAIVEISQPIMFMNCHEPENDIIDNELQLQPNESYCLREELSSFDRYSASNSETGETQNCEWKLMNVDYQLKTSLQAKIPRGDKKKFPPILYATIVLSWIVALWTVFRTHAVPIRVNQKLEEQRILQTKNQ